jgi:hypothetical protein
MEQSPSWEADSHLASQKCPRLLWKSLPLDPIIARWFQSISSYPVSMRSIWTLSSQSWPSFCRLLFKYMSNALTEVNTSRKLTNSQRMIDSKKVTSSIWGSRYRSLVLVTTHAKKRLHRVHWSCDADSWNTTNSALIDPHIHTFTRTHISKVKTCLLSCVLRKP